MSTTSSTPFPLGVFVGNANSDDSGAEATFDASNEGFDSLMGTTPTFMNTYIDFTETPSNWLSNNGWAAASSEASPSWKGVTPVIALPMGSTNADAPSAEQILENYADGSYDSMLQGMVQTWASDGFMTQYWRPGVEMNLSSTPGFVGSSASTSTRRCTRPPRLTASTSRSSGTRALPMAAQPGTRPRRFIQATNTSMSSAPTSIPMPTRSSSTTGTRAGRKSIPPTRSMTPACRNGRPIRSTSSTTIPIPLPISTRSTVAAAAP
jgi:hypothetical protein